MLKSGFIRTFFKFMSLFNTITEMEQIMLRIYNQFYKLAFKSLTNEI